MSPGVASVRADICSDCPTPCARQHDVAFHADACAQCPLERPLWHPHDCGVVQDTPPLPPAGDGRSPLLRRVNTYRRAGVLVGLGEFLARRPACRTCDLRLTLPTHPGLYGCGGCATCGGGPERMLVVSSTCKLKRWPIAPRPTAS